MEMASDITGQWRIFITDRGYSSILVNEKLFQQGTLHVGTIRTDRKDLSTDAKTKQPFNTIWKSDKTTMYWYLAHKSYLLLTMGERKSQKWCTFTIKCAAV